MATTVIMPALEMAQETGKVIRWLVAPGTTVAKGQAIVEIETDKITVEIESPAAGVLGDVTAAEGDVVPVGRTIALIFAAGEATTVSPAPLPPQGLTSVPQGAGVKSSPLARKIAEQHGVDLAQVKTKSGRVEKADVLAHVERQKVMASAAVTARLAPASPKARRLAAERGMDIKRVSGTGPNGAVQASDILSAHFSSGTAASGQAPAVGTVWRVMAERMTQSWTSAPHFYLVREVNASRLLSWRESVMKKTGVKITITDLLVKLVAVALAEHPRMRVSWKDGALIQHAEVNIGLAVAIDDGLVVPVIHKADTLSLVDLAARRVEMVKRAQSGKLRPADITGGVFTISNLGMFGVDAFNAIVNPPQAAILAVGRIADRVVAVKGQAVVQPTMVLTLSCDHRAVDGARGARFLGALSDLVEEPILLVP